MKQKLTKIKDKIGNSKTLGNFKISFSIMGVTTKQYKQGNGTLVQ